LRDAGRHTLGGLAQMRRALVTRATTGKLLPDEVGEGTFTITNLGTHGIDVVSPIINPPQSAILGVGQIRERVIAAEGQAVVRPTCILTLSVDHRVVDGAAAAEFLNRVRELAEKPQLWHS
jgi:pyruvate dehydrogenase E2 component (dihydrolipoamide acetyltransferase)